MAQLYATQEQSPNALIIEGKVARLAKDCYTTPVSEEEAKPRMVQCAKLGQSLLAMVYKPFDDELGARIVAEISQDAWSQWIEHSKMIVNEYRLDLTSEKSHTTLKEQCEEFLFGEAAAAPPPEFVPESESESES